MNATYDYDLTIIGGGMAGATLALALSGQGLRIALVETQVAHVDSVPNYDERAIALAYGSSLIFRNMGLWPDLAPWAEPIRDIHVSERGRWGFTRLHAAEEQVPALGYVIAARALGRVLLAALTRCSDVEVLAPASLVEFDLEATGARFVIESSSGRVRLNTRLLVAADGAQSFVRERLNIPTRRWQYHQSAVVANITPSRAHANVAYERFTEHGPIALLPMSEGRCALVWTVPDDGLEAVLALDDDGFLRAFQQHFGGRLGRFMKVGRRSAYPLAMLRATESVRERCVIIGNAAHTLHPIAGQGFNLGIRDVAALVDVVLDAHGRGEDVGASVVLAAYEGLRQGEQRGVALATDMLARVFANPLAPLRIGRNLGLLALDLAPGARHGLARAAMGLFGARSRLACGDPHG